MEIGVILDCSSQFSREAEYVFRTLFDTLGVTCTVYPADTRDRIVERPACDVLVYYGRGDDPRRQGDGYLVKISCEDYEAIWLNARSQVRITRGSGTRGIPAGHVLIAACATPPAATNALLIDECDEKPLISFSEEQRRVDILFDIVASVFHMLSFGGRSESFWAAMPEEPMVNYCMEILLRLLALLARKRGSVLLQKWYWPRSNDSAVALAHNGELGPAWSLKTRVARAVREMMQLKRTSFLSGVSTVIGFAKMRKEPFWNLSDLVKLETEHNLSSSFYFPMGSGSLFRSAVSEQRASALLQELKRSAFEVGLDASERSCTSLERLSEEKGRLEKLLRSDIAGCHRRESDASGVENCLFGEHAAFSYYNSSPLENRLGYPRGLAFPYFPYVAEEGRASRVLEIPIAITDDALFKQEPNVADALARVAGITRKAARHHALLGVLWSSDAFTLADFSHRWHAYREILSGFDGKWVFNDTSANLAKWWIERGAVTVSRFARSESGLEWTLRSASGIRHLTLKLYSGFHECDIEVSGVAHFQNWVGSIATVQLQTIEPGTEVGVAVRKKEAARK